jgi:hypothetical protein
MAEIGVLLESSPRDAAILERTLTDGYATMLTLEAERSRLDKELLAVAASMGGADVRGKSQELAEIARRVERSDDELARLRTLLVRLRAEYSVLTAETVCRPRPTRRNRRR